MKEEEERKGRYLLGCMIGTTVGIGWDSGAFRSMKIPRHLHPTGLETLVHHIHEHPNLPWNYIKQIFYQTPSLINKQQCNGRPGYKGHNGFPSV